jgi:site-specific DNA-cytosine methylase
MDLTYLELFAGAGGMSLGLETAGWRCVAHAEIEPHARAVLRHHWPDVPLYGDVAELDGTQFRGVTMVTGGSPCQDLSIAGKRAGMTEGSGTRSSLFFEQVRIWNESQAPYILWENVYGAFSSNAGRDFAAVLSALVGGAVPVPADGWVRAGVVAGPTGVAAWRVLDAQYFGVPQRRRRVFVLGVRGGGVDPAEVLSLAESLSGHLAASGEAREGVATDARAGTTGASTQYGDIAGSLTARADGSPCADRGPNVVYATDARAGASVTRTGFSTTGSVGYVHDVMPTLPHKTGLGCAGAQMIGVIEPMTFSTPAIGDIREDSVSSTITKNTGGGGETQNPAFVLAIDIYNQSISPNGVAHTIRAMNTGEGIPHTVTYEWHNQDSRIKEVNVAATLNLNAEGREGRSVLHGVPIAFHQTQDPIASDEVSPALGTTSGGMGVLPSAVTLRNREGKPGGGKGPLLSAERSLTLGTTNDQVVFTHQQFGGYSEGNDVAPTMQARDYKDATTLAMGQVGTPRRLTPTECERLMGWPDQHTAHGINDKGRAYDLPDTGRYKLCGNGIASPVTAWIGFQLRHYLTSGKPSPIL